MDLALNNIQTLIWYETKKPNQTFSLDISLKMNIITWLESELSYFKDAD